MYHKLLLGILISILFLPQAFATISVEELLNNTYDEEVKCLGTIEVEHAEIHKGDHYTAISYDSNVASGSSVIWQISTPTSGETHFTFGCTSSLNGLIEFYENPTINVQGISATVYNNKRDSTNTYGGNFYWGSTTTADGTLLYVQVMGSDGANPTGISGAGMQRENEFILDANEDYIIKFTSSSNNNRVSMISEFYTED